MHYLRCIHPPGGASALMAVIGGNPIHALGYSYVTLDLRGFRSGSLNEAIGFAAVGGQA